MCLNPDAATEKSDRGKCKLAQRGKLQKPRNSYSAARLLISIDPPHAANFLKATPNGHKNKTNRKVTNRLRK
jgi:hypothetical protein